MQTRDIEAIVARHKGRPGDVLAILEDIQSRYRHLPKEALELVARGTSRPLVDIYGVATFYKLFTFEPRGQHLVSVCLGTACHVRRAPLVVDEFERRLGVAAGRTTPDETITLETVNCVGACALGPIVVSDGHYFPNVAPTAVQKIIDRTRHGLDHVDPRKDPRVFPVVVRCGRCNRSLMDPDYPLEGYPTVRVTISFGSVLGWLRLSSLYGSPTIASEHEVPLDTVVQFFCPHCHAELLGAASCLECSAAMIPMVIEGGGVVHVCPRRGCRGHRLDL